MRKVGEKRRSVDETRVIGHVNVVLIGAYVLSSVNANACEDAPGDKPAPPPGAPVLHAARAIEGPQQKRERRHYHGVGVPQQIGEWRPEINKQCLELRHLCKQRP